MNLPFNVTATVTADGVVEVKSTNELVVKHRRPVSLAGWFEFALSE